MFLKAHPVCTATDKVKTQTLMADIGLDIDLDVLNTDRFRWEMTRVTLGGSELCYCRNQGRVRLSGRVTDDCYFVWVSQRGELTFESGSKRAIVSPGAPLVLPEELFIAETSPSSEMIIAKLKKSAVRAALKDRLQYKAYGPLVFRFSNSFSSPEKVQLLQQYLTFLYEQAGVASDAATVFSPLALAQAENLLSTLLLEALPNTYSDKLETSESSPELPWHLKAAEEVIRERLPELTSTEKLARAIGVSPRTLTRAFLQVKGVTPNRYLRKLRFQRARHDLREARRTDTVTDIALRWGFHHLGRFSVEYRREFSESPSQTLRASS